MKRTVKIELSDFEIAMIYTGISCYLEYLEKQKKKEKTDRRLEIEKIQRRAENLQEFISLAGSKIK